MGHMTLTTPFDKMHMSSY